MCHGFGDPRTIQPPELSACHRRFPLRWRRTTLGYLEEALLLRFKWSMAIAASPIHNAYL
jgi:hypothetical protein